MKKGLLLTSSLCIGLLAGCTAQPVKQATVETPISITNQDLVKPVAITKVVAKMPRGTPVGKIEGGWACVVQPGGDIQWGTGGKVAFTTEELVDIFREELESAGWPVVGSTDNLFEDYNVSEAELLLGAKISDLKANICYPNAGFGNWFSGKGEMFMEVEWQVYSPRTKQVIGTVISEGSNEIKSSTNTVAADLLANSFAIATRNLLAQDDFHNLVKRVDSQAIDNEYGTLVINNAKTNGPNSSYTLEEAKKSVVSVRTANGHGSGFSIGDGTKVLTNAHVVGDAKNVTIVSSGGVSLNGRVLRVARERDIALIDITPSSIKPMSLNLSQKESGSEVYAIGSPFKEEFSGTVTRGILSGYREYDGLKWYQSDVAVNPGNSGGPLLDTNYHVIGLTTVGFGGTGSGLNLFVPIDNGLEFLELDLSVN